ncbi:hypothetical protein ASF53_14660 [Methylobacterium sp. Leaf123]|uniref:hypothetical protein n=1 Tax=Methylobacterium sp. Leaf123 TaxID=1736264 RepID=UPI0006FE7458|nr:hypothetical protein [Methylobacterium sp. Leaf123]KQQ11915.1 hypothetical protein ASF53_14660 [Methylobacterium sp. Leaf123]
MPEPSEPRGAPATGTPSRPNPKKTRKRVPDTRRLRVQLRAHIERQIARFDAALDAETSPAGLDSAKVLRDLGGLKNMLDDIKAADRAAREGRTDGEASRPPLPTADLVAMRTDIALRYAAFAAAEPDDGVLDPSLAGPSAPA